MPIHVSAVMQASGTSHRSEQASAEDDQFHFAVFEIGQKFVNDITTLYVPRVIFEDAAVHWARMQ